jgi:hypothetical protein
MDGTGEYHVKQNKPGAERQISHALSHMQNLDLETKTQETGTYKGLFGRQVPVGGEKDMRVMGGKCDQSALYSSVHV